jgi:arylsulfatase A-like enzyme
MHVRRSVWYGRAVPSLRRLALLVVVGMAVGLVVARAVRTPSGTAAPNVVLIVLDTLRADRVGTGLTPVLDRFAADAVVYERAYSASSWTVPSVASLLLGQYPSEHQVLVVNAVLPEHALSIAEVLTAHGWVSGGFSANLEISGDAGFGQGFDAFRVVFAPPKEDAARVTSAALEWLDDVAPRRRPVFLYLQYMEPHGPYRAHTGVTAPPAAPLGVDDALLAGRVNDGAFLVRDGAPLPDAWRFTPPELARLAQLYDGEVAYLDASLGELFAALDARGILRDAIVVVTADHGEQLGEHGLFSHGHTLFEQTIHVPLLVRLPGTAPRRVTAPVSAAGVAPAVLRHLAIPVPASFDVPPLPLDDDGTGVAYSEAFKGQASYLLLHRRAVVGRAGKLLVTPGGEELFFDLAEDASESRPTANAPFARALRAALPPAVADAAVTPAGAPADGDLRARLRALGYAD